VHEVPKECEGVSWYGVLNPWNRHSMQRIGVNAVHPTVIIARKELSWNLPFYPFTLTLFLKKFFPFTLIPWKIPGY
jgi:hypothetical protein